MSSFLVSASGLTAQRTRLDVIAENIANASTTHPTPYRRKMVVFQEILDENSNANEPPRGGVRVKEIVQDVGENAFRVEYDPTHPDANEEGYLLMPNINPVHEMVDLIDAMRAYEANVTALTTTKDLAVRTLEIGR